MTGRSTPPAPDPRTLRSRARELTGIAHAAEHAAARFAAHALAGDRSDADERIGGALSEFARAHRRAAELVDGYAADLEGAVHRRRALDDLVSAAQATPSADGQDAAVLARVERLRSELLTRLDRDLEAAALRCAEQLQSAAPSPRQSAEVAHAVGAAVDLARSRLLQATADGAAPTPDWRADAPSRSV